MTNLGYLDGIRGYMALWVLASHLIQRAHGPDIFLVKGGIAVDIFMLVSGILMTHNILGREEKEPIHEARTWQRFFTRRFFRIAPLYYLAFAFAVVFYAPLAEMANALGGTNSSNISQWDNLAQNIILHLTFVYGLMPEWSSSNILPDWSLSLEMQFYLIFPLLLFLLRWNVVAFFVLMIAAYAIGMQFFCVYHDAPNCVRFPQPSVLALKITCFAAGMVLVYGTSFAKSTFARILCAISFVAFIAYEQRLTYTILAIGCAFMHIGAVHNINFRPAKFVHTISDQILSSRPSKFLGDISYGVYLCHFLILFPVLYYARGLGFFEIDSEWHRFLVATIAVGTPSILLAWLLHRHIETPGIQLGRDICSKYFR